MNLLDLGKYRRSHIAQRLMMLDGRPFSLYDYPFLRPVYDLEHKEILLKTGRQVGKSVGCAALMLTDCVRQPHFRTLYVAPTREQTSRFSNTRMYKIFRYSPLLREAFSDPGGANNVLLLVLANGSELALSYAWDDPDRVRGITADRELVDEVQDILYEATIPVIKACMHNSDYGYMMYAGTPKSMENTIEFLWQGSTQSEWIMECKGCGSWQFVESVKSIGRKGIICLGCGKGLNPREGQWYDFNPTAKRKGFHISQPILPRNNEIPARWERILQDMEEFSETKFKNEVLGLSDAIGSRFISLDELVGLCQDYFVTLPIRSQLLEDIKFTFGGVDWGGEGKDLVSRTVAWVFGLTENFKKRTLYFKIFDEGVNPIDQVNEVVRIFEECTCQFVIGDAGNGALANAVLAEKLGKHRVGQAQYGGGAGFTYLIRWSRQAERYLVNRTAAIDDYMLDMKQEGVVFPSARQMATPIQDILNEYEESTKTGVGDATRKVWRHAHTAPDDCLHAQIYANLALKVIQGDVRMYESDSEASEVFGAARA